MPAIPGYAHLAQDEGYRGGMPRVAASGQSVYAIWHWNRAGRTPVEITEIYEGLTLAAVHSALAYAADHVDEMLARLEQDRRDEQENRKNFPLPPALKEAAERARLLRRS